ncbi:hypothetical protein BGW42_004698 [Actinomortierella wolfii]|nr:hypothetical protein BGW42_004698 [Actinomortierella wolfii]
MLPPPLVPPKLPSSLPAEDITLPEQEMPDSVLRTPRIVRDAVFSYVHPEDQSSNARLLSWNTAMAALLGSPEPDRRRWSAEEEAMVLKLLTGATKDQHLIDTLFPTLAATASEGAENNDKKGGLHPWAHCYGGHQFGFYAGQLGDGRAITLYEAVAPSTGVSWELQLKGAGKTPYSRFADGYAVLRSSIREYLGAEAVAALGVESSRSLSLASTDTLVMREEGPEPGAIVCRLAPSWIRFGSFEIFHYRRDYKNLRRLAEYVAKELYGLEDTFDTTNTTTSAPDSEPTPTSSAPAVTTTEATSGADQLNGNDAKNEDDKSKQDQPNTPTQQPSNPSRPFIYNRFARMFEEVARRTARMVSGWQAIGFCHGVINTDNMSILGLTIDYGPYAFLDRYDPTWICNHSDDQGRYMYQSQPGICLWNLTKLALTLEALIGAEDRVDDEAWFTQQQQDKQAEETLKARGSDIIVEVLQRGFREEFLTDYRRRMNAKMGLHDEVRDSDLEDIVVPALAWMDEFEVDYHNFFRQLARYRTTTTAAAANGTEQGKAGAVPSREANIDHVRQWVERVVEPIVWKVRGDEAVAATESWLSKYHERIVTATDDAVRVDKERRHRMNSVNPAFVLRNWVAQKVIERVTAVVEKDRQDRLGKDDTAAASSSTDAAAIEADRDLLDRVLEMCQNPFGEQVEEEEEEEESVVNGQACKVVKNNTGLEKYGEFVGPVPEWGQGIQCSCSS